MLIPPPRGQAVDLGIGLKFQDTNAKVFENLDDARDRGRRPDLKSGADLPRQARRALVGRQGWGRDAAVQWRSEVTFEADISLYPAAGRSLERSPLSHADQRLPFAVADSGE